MLIATGPFPETLPPKSIYPFVPLFAAWQVVLARYCGQQDFAIGVPSSGRQQEDFQEAWLFTKHMPSTSESGHDAGDVSAG